MQETIDSLSGGWLMALKERVFVLRWIRLSQQHVVQRATYFENVGSIANNLKGQIIIACALYVHVCSHAWLCIFVMCFFFVFVNVRSITTLSLVLLFQLNREAHCLRSVSYCELIILCWNCVSVCVCVYFVTAKEMTEQSIISHLPHPDLIFLNALTQWLLQMNLQCQSHSFELQRWKRERERAREVGVGGGTRGEGARWLLFPHCGSVLD